MLIVDARSLRRYAVTIHSLGNLSTFAASYYHRVSLRVLPPLALSAHVAPVPPVARGSLTNRRSPLAARSLLQVNKDVEAGAKVVYDTKSTTGGVSLEVGAKTYLDNAAFVKAKVNNSGIVALGYTQALRPGVKVGFGLALDTQRLNDASAGASAHKVGASFTFNS